MSMMRDFNSWSELRDLLRGMSIVAINPGTGLVVMSDGSILDLSLKSLHLVKATLVPHDFAAPDDVIQAVETSTYGLTSGDGAITDVHVSVLDHASQRPRGYVLLKVKTTPDLPTGISKFLLASHTRYVRGAELVREVEKEVTGRFQ